MRVLTSCCLVFGLGCGVGCADAARAGAPSASIGHPCDLLEVKRGCDGETGAVIECSATSGTWDKVADCPAGETCTAAFSDHASVATCVASGAPVPDVASDGAADAVDAGVLPDVGGTDTDTDTVTGSGGGGAKDVPATPEVVKGETASVDASKPKDVSKDI